MPMEIRSGQASGSATNDGQINVKQTCNDACGSNPTCSCQEPPHRAPHSGTSYKCTFVAVSAQHGRVEESIRIRMDTDLSNGSWRYKPDLPSPEQGTYELGWQHLHAGLVHIIVAGRKSIELRKGVTQSARAPRHPLVGRCAPRSPPVQASDLGLMCWWQNSRAVTCRLVPWLVRADSSSVMCPFAAGI
ncbi:hypothetical protein K461DRAFT_18206 [Myriangium duriaei CBS 260.36]|uniref:Uncharacterized protein n=1 Tax=Myriangium duriaei CBS 260.36 TaxID=1168546 RepID=A0A9P4MLJ9_9PEZI|nr:hypothetical protein K461DRAFT_18206 [Myriangium duriaei CBS 260.36]